MSETTLERPITASKTDGRASLSFDFDRRAFVLRVVLCACLGVCSVILSIMAWQVASVGLLLTVALPLTIVVAWFSALRLRMTPPIITLDRNGIWDQRLGMDPVPWREVRAIKLDLDMNVILDVGSNFRHETGRQRERIHRFLLLGSSQWSGNIRIRLDELDTTLPDFLAAVDAVLPHHMQAPVCPARLRRSRQLVRPVFAGVIAGLMVGPLIVTLGLLRENATIYRGLGVVRDLGIQPGDSGEIGFVHARSLDTGAATDRRIRLGYTFHVGQGVPRDDVKAAHQFGLAAADGVAEGQAALGYFREIGIGVAQDFIKAIDWYRKAGEQGDSWALTRLALMYRDGRGVPRDQEQAFRLLQAAAAQAEMSAQFYLGEAFENGWGVSEDITEALEWYRKAAAQGHARAEYKLGSLYSDGRSVPRSEDQAVDWFERSARKGYAPAQYALGMAYELGLSVPRDPVRAVLWYQLAQWHGHSTARHHRMQFLQNLSQGERLAANSYRRRWLRKKFLSGPASAKFAEFQRLAGPKAFAASMSGAWAIASEAKDQNEAMRLAMARCRHFSQTCLLYALGDEVVIDKVEPHADVVSGMGERVSGR